MTTQPVAGKDLACSFYVQGRHVVLLQGWKPSGAEVELQEGGSECGIPNLHLTVTPPAEAAREEGIDRYYLVRAVFSPGPMRPRIRLIRSDEPELLMVRPLICRRCCAAVTGGSQSFCFDEAFQDALRQLPPFRKTDKDQPLPLVDVVAMGAVYSGFSGFSRFFLRLEASENAARPAV